MQSTYSPALRSALRKVTARLIPFLFVLYIVAYLDRSNVSFAALQMPQDLGIDKDTWKTVFGFGSGVFFLGYFLFEFPSNLILEKVGPRIWIARIMIIWGILAAGMALVRTPTQFYVMRFLLGLGEAGFFPGIIYYLTCWYPAKERARAIGLFMTATVMSNVIGGPISGVILHRMHGFLGLHGWEWVFIAEGLPACILAIVVLFYMTDRPDQAHWLPADEREALIARLRREHEHRVSRGHHPSLKALLDPKVVMFALIYFCVVSGSYGVSMWLPQFIKSSLHVGEEMVGVLTAIPYSLAAVCMVLNGRHSDATGERKLHVIVPVLLGAAGLALSGLLNGTPWLAFAALSLGAIGIASYLGPFWALPTAFLGGTAAAGGIALINSVGNLGGFVGPYLVGWIQAAVKAPPGQEYLYPLLALSAIVVCGAFLVMVLKHDPSLEHVDDGEEAEPVLVLGDEAAAAEPA